MFSIGMSAAGNTFFAISTMLVGVPTGIKLFNWIGTMCGGQSDSGLGSPHPG